MASDIKTNSQSFAATGVGTSLPNSVGMASAIPSVYIGGGSGTVQLQARPSGQTNFEPLIPLGAASANMTAPGVYTFPTVGGDYEYQLNCTVFTSGPIPAQLQLSPSP